MDVFFGGGGQRFAFPAPLRHAEDALRRVPQKFPDDGIRVRRAFQLPRFPALALFYGENRGVIGIAAFHAQKIPFCVADAVTQRAEPVGIRVIKGDGADSGDALPQIDPKPRPGAALPGGNGHGAAAVPPADDQLGVAVAALKRPADILGAINGGRVDLDDLVTDLQSGGSGLGAQNVVKGSNRDRIVAELQTHDLPHGDQQFCCPGVYRKQRHRDSKNRQKFPDSFHFFSPPHVRACLVNMTRAEKHNRCKCRKIRNRMGTLAFFVLILILYLGTSE